MVSTQYFISTLIVIIEITVFRALPFLARASLSLSLSYIFLLSSVHSIALNTEFLS